jgi:tRNA(fMet)-specific endonuclease VapC
LVRSSYLLDTNILSLAFRAVPDANVERHLRAHEGEFAIASVVWHELLFGCRRLPPSRRRDHLERLLFDVVQPFVPILAYDEVAADWHARERVRLAAHLPPFVDGQIAAIAATRNLTLVTVNVRDFERFEGLRIDDWSARA